MNQTKFQVKLSNNMMDISPLHPGIYFLSIEYEGKIHIQKIIKL